jgi:hypothetical protein
LIQGSDVDREQTECEAGKAAALGNHRAMSMDEEVTIDDSRFVVDSDAEGVSRIGSRRMMLKPTTVGQDSVTSLVRDLSQVRKL